MATAKYLHKSSSELYRERRNACGKGFETVKQALLRRGAFADFLLSQMFLVAKQE
jgi:hypothetical protein